MKEKTIEKQIIDYLNICGILNWKNKNTGTAFIRDGKLRYRKEKGVRNGLSDLCAFHNGEILFLEVKTKKGRQTDYQKLFQKEIEKAGGQYSVVRSVYDVQEILKKKGWIK